ARKRRRARTPSRSSLAFRRIEHAHLSMRRRPEPARPALMPPRHTSRKRHATAACPRRGSGHNDRMDANHRPNAETPLDYFFAMVLGDPSLQDTLRRPAEIKEFVALAVDTARRGGVALAAEDVHSAMRGPLPGIGDLNERWHEPPLPPDDWLPIRAAWRDGRLLVEWTCFGDRRLREPFFQGDVRRSLSEP